MLPDRVVAANKKARLIMGIAQLSSAHLMRPTSPKDHSVIVATIETTAPIQKGLTKAQEIARQTSSIASEPQSPFTALPYTSERTRPVTQSPQAMKSKQDTARKGWFSHSQPTAKTGT